MNNNSLDRENIKKTTFSGVIFKLLERVGINLLGLVVSIILARLLEPKVIGVVTLAETLVLLFSVVATYGFGNSLIQNKNSDETDASTAFIASLCFAGVLFIMVFLFAPWVERYYGYEEYGFSTVTRVLALSIFPTSVKSIEQALIAKRMRFKYFLYSSLVTSIISGLIGIGMAVRGFGIWSIVFQFLSSEVVSTIVLALLLRWMPNWKFSWKSLKWIIDFGWKLILVGVINVLYTQIRSLVIAKKYSSSDLAYYNRGLKFAQIVPENLSEALMAVLFPLFSNYTDDNGILSSVRKSIKASTFMVFPMCLGLFAIAENLVLVLLTDKWSESIQYLRIFCIAYLFYTIEQIIDQSIKALGKSGTLLMLNIIKKLIGIGILIITFNKSVLSIANGFFVSMVINYFISMILARKMLSYKICTQIKDFYRELVASIFMAVVCMLMAYLPIQRVLILVFQIIGGMIVYLGLSILINRESLNYMKEVISNATNKKTEELDNAH